MPLVIALIIRLGVPALATFLNEGFAFELAPYYPFLMSAFVLNAPIMIGMIIGFLLLDERDERMLRALLVTPMPLRGYLLYRISLPLVLGFVMTLVSYPIAGLTPMRLMDLLIISLLASFAAPLVALFVASFAENKVAGFAMLKIANAVLLIPAVAFFIDSNWTLVTGIVPTYWPVKGF